MEQKQINRGQLPIKLKRINTIAVLRAQATKEKQINRRAELNLEVNRLQSELKNIIENL
jgi:hypothetical protein